jgi:hypothetical protein
MIVSEDSPLDATPLSTVTRGVALSGSTVDNHCDIAAGKAVTSLLEHCSRLTCLSIAG